MAAGQALNAIETPQVAGGKSSNVSRPLATSRRHTPYYISDIHPGGIRFHQKQTAGYHLRRLRIELNSEGQVYARIAQLPGHFGLSPEPMHGPL